MLDYTGTLNDSSTINVVGTPAESYALLKPNSGSNSTNWYELQTQILTATWSGTASTAWDTTTANWSGPGGNQYISGQPVVFDDTAGTGAVNIAATVTPYSVTFANNQKLYTLGGTAGIGGAATVALTGTGTVILANSNTYTGSTTIGIGATLQLGNGATAGSVNNSVITDNGTLAFASPSALTYATAITGSGGVAQKGPGALMLTATNSFGGPISVTASTLYLDNVFAAGSATTFNVGGGTANASLVWGHPAGSGTDIASTSTGASVNVLAGAGTVTLGCADTNFGTITATYAGTISLGQSLKLLTQGANGGSSQAISFTGPFTETGGSSFGLEMDDSSSSTPGTGNTILTNLGAGGAVVQNGATYLVGTTPKGFSGAITVNSGFVVYRDWSSARLYQTRLPSLTTVRRRTIRPTTATLVLNGGSFMLDTQAAAGSTANVRYTYDAPVTIGANGGGLFSLQENTGNITV